MLQSQEVGVYVDVSVNVTVRGESPERGVAVKEAIGVRGLYITRGAIAPDIYAPPLGPDPKLSPAYGCPYTGGFAAHSESTLNTNCSVPDSLYEFPVSGQP
jgi:hypothetical protein